MSISAWDTQVGGSHYQHYKIQPMEFFIANQIPYPQAAIIKYVLRYKDKNGLQDLQKAKHIIDMLIEEEADNGFGKVCVHDESTAQYALAQTKGLLGKGKYGILKNAGCI